MGQIFACSLLAVLFSASNPSTSAKLPPLSEDPTLSTLLAETNRQRARYQLPPLQPHEGLMLNGQRWANWMDVTGVFRHNPNRKGAEVIAYGTRTPKATVRMWLNSPGHRRILLGNYTHAGFGAQWYNGRYFWVGVFARRR